MKPLVMTVSLLFLPIVACTFVDLQGTRNAAADELLIPFQDQAIETHAKVEIQKLRPNATESEINHLMPGIIEKFQHGAIEKIKGAQIGSNLLTNIMKRGQHPKHLGCVRATVDVITPVDQPDLHVGVFNPNNQPTQYKAVIRFSKGAHTHDGQADSYGMAIKLFGVEGGKLLAGEESAKTQDFLLASHPVFTAPNPRMLLKFVQTGLAGKNTLGNHDPDNKYYQGFLKIRHNSRKVIKSPLDINYWSQTPYKLGAKAVKYRIVQIHASIAENTPRFKNDLRLAMEKHLTTLKIPARFEFQIEKWIGDGLPLEDPTRNWNENCEDCTSTTSVATITIPPQTFLTPEMMAFCEQLSFTPWHSLPDHQPLGQINQARKVVYHLGSQLRHVVNRASSQEPEWKDYEKVKEGEARLYDRGHPVQGWTREGQVKFYHTPQGTRIMPFTWFLALKQIGKKRAYVLDDPNLSRWGLLPDPKNRYGLPVGFAKSEYPDTKNQVHWVDLTCAGCHTGQLRYRGNIVRVEGGPTMQWNRRFFQLMVGALKETVEEHDKFENFADEVFTLMLELNEPKVQAANDQIKKMMAGLEHEGPAVKQKKLEKIKALVKTELVKQGKHELRKNIRRFINAAIRGKVDEKTKALYPTTWGHGRFDALGRGGNLFLSDLHPDNLRQASAPVSVPKIWDAWKYDWVQWNGSITQPTGRNIGEAIGVRAKLEIEVHQKEKQPPVLSIETSVNLKNLVALEQHIRKLTPPRWPEGIFGGYDRAKAKEGKQLYERHCAECHVPKDRNGNHINPNVQPNYDLEPFKMTLKGVRAVGTDPTAATNFYSRTIKTGRLQEIIGKNVLSAADAVQWLTTGVRKTLLDNLVDEITKVTPDIQSDIADILRLVEASQESVLPSPEKDQFITTINQKIGELKKKSGAHCTPDLLLADGKDHHERNVCVFLELVKQDKGRRNIYRDPLKYIARTNAGIWATAPFLHNGSVPTLYQLLSPVRDRDTKFCLGNLEFDPVHVGFVTRKPPCVPFIEFEFDTTLLNNSNQGHEFRNLTPEEEKIGQRCDVNQARPSGIFGCEFSEHDRWALIEYLKTLDCTNLTLECWKKDHERI